LGVITIIVRGRIRVLRDERESCYQRQTYDLKHSHRSLNIPSVGHQRLYAGASPAHAHDQGHEKNDQEYIEQNLCDSSGGCSHPGESENGSNQRDD
jgi:hypothetical protein